MCRFTHSIFYSDDTPLGLMLIYPVYQSPTSTLNLKEEGEPSMSDDIASVEIRVTQSGKTSNYIKYAFQKLEEGSGIVQIMSTGRSVNKVVSIAEIIKRSVPNLHQISEISECEVESGMGLDSNLKSTLTITLSREPVDVNHYGYQNTSREDKTQSKVETRSRRKRKDIEDSKNVL
jgi:DNA-binding protein